MTKKEILIDALEAYLALLIDYCYIEGSTITPSDISRCEELLKEAQGTKEATNDSNV